MSDTTTTNLGLTKPALNGSANTWGQKLNTNFDLIDTRAASTASTLTSHGTRLTSLETAAASIVPIGGIILWSGSLASVPTGWRLCDGSFGTPNLTNRFVMGAGSATAPGTIGGSTSATASTTSAGAHTHGGATGGTALNTAQIPSHTHTGATSTAGAHTHGITGINLVADTFPNSNVGKNNTGGGNGFSYYQATTDGDHSHTFTTDATGGGGAHTHTIASDGAHTHEVTVNVTPPFFVLAYIMRVA